MTKDSSSKNKPLKSDLNASRGRVFIFPGEFTDLNTYIQVERGNRYAASNIKRTETSRVAMQLKGEQPINERVYMHYHWVLPNRRKDPSNVAFACKFIEDGFVEAGILANDGHKQIAGIFHTYGFDKDCPRVVVTTEIAS